VPTGNLFTSCTTLFQQQLNLLLIHFLSYKVEIENLAPNVNVSPADVEHVNSVDWAKAGAEAVSVSAHGEPLSFMRLPSDKANR